MLEGSHPTSATWLLRAGTAQRDKLGRCLARSPPSPAPDTPLLPSAAWSQTAHTGREPSAKLPLPPPLHSLRLSLLLEVASRSTQSTLPSKLLLSRAVWMRHLQRRQQNTLACMGLPGPRRERKAEPALGAGTFQMPRPSLSCIRDAL